MKNSKNSSAMAILLVLLAVALLVCTAYFSTRDKPAPEQEPLPEQSAASEAPPTLPSGVPDIDSTQTSSEKPYEAVEWGSIGETVMSDEEVLLAVGATLDGLLKLDPAAIVNVSAGTTSGAHNPFRVMLDAVAADGEMKAAFLKMAGASSYETLRIEKISSGTYEVTVSCTTPYMAAVITELAAAEQPYPFQEFTTFRSSGAAAQIAEMDMTGIPLHTDAVTLMVIVKNDVPIIYHPVSLAYGDTVPQYAFLWGGTQFQGVKDGDLLLANHLGGGTVLAEEEILSDPQLSQVTRYLSEAFGKFAAADISGFMGLSLEGVSQGAQFAAADTYPDYLKKFEDYGPLEKDTADRLKSFQYEVGVYRCAIPGIDAELYIAAVTYSVFDPLTGGRNYYTAYHLLDGGGRGNISEADAEFVCMFADTVFENALGGDASTLTQRIYLSGEGEAE